MTKQPTPELWRDFDKLGPGSNHATRADAPVAIYRDPRRRNALFHICDEHTGHAITSRGYTELTGAMVACERLWPARHKRIVAIVPDDFNIESAVAAHRAAKVTK